MKNKAWFSIVFMFLCTAFFTAILSGVYVYTRPLIMANNRVSLMRAHFSAFDVAIPTVGAPTELETIYDQQIQAEDINGYSALVYKDDAENVLHYGFPFTGPGLWGTIEGILALSEDLTTVIGIDFITQNETPGLGGRIEEDWFIEQFRGVILYEGDAPLRYTTSTAEGQVDAITGATATSVAVVNMLNEKILEVRQELGGER